MSVLQMGLVWKHSKATDSLLLLLLAIADYADDFGIAYPGVAALAKKIRKGERQTQYLIRRGMADGQLIVYEQAATITTPGGVQRTNVYQLVTGAPFEKGVASTAPPLAWGVQPDGQGGAVSEQGGAVIVAPKPSYKPPDKPSDKDSPLTGGRRPTQVSTLVDRYRALDGITPSPKDGGVIAGLVKRLGSERVNAALDEAAEAIVAADNPLLFLIAVAEGRGRREEQSLEDRAKELARR